MHENCLVNPKMPPTHKKYKIVKAKKHKSNTLIHLHQSAELFCVLI